MWVGLVWCIGCSRFSLFCGYVRLGWVYSGETRFGKWGGSKQEKRTFSGAGLVVGQCCLPEGKVAGLESASLLAATLSGGTRFGKRGGCLQEKRDLANQGTCNRRNALLREPGWLLAGRVCKMRRLPGLKVHLSYTCRYFRISSGRLRDSKSSYMKVR
jgi:hypothetical protein